MKCENLKINEIKSKHIKHFIFSAMFVKFYFQRRQHLYFQHSKAWFALPGSDKKKDIQGVV